MLKKYQIIEPLDAMDELDQNARLIIYPCVNVVLMTDDIRAMLESLRAEPAESFGAIQDVDDTEEDEGDEMEEILEAGMTAEENKMEEPQKAGATAETNEMEKTQEADIAAEPEGEPNEGTEDEA